jgi:Secretion system C-terminal sorting domain
LVNNAAGVTLNTTLKVDGIATFTNGNITTTITNPIVFTSNGTVTGASDASHVNGYVVKEGTGAFTYPVGDGTRYQQCAVNLTANGTGMQVKYNTTDAGAGTFTIGGTEATALIAYNKLEHWDIAPLSTATGTVTMHWDNYNNAGIVNISDLKCAHKVGANWLNEGTAGTGTIGAGSITSNSISSWSPFTLGSVVNSTLPLRWLNINGNLNTQKQAVINWQVQETNVANYIVEKSTDGRTFATVGNISSIGNGTNNYSFTDAQAINGVTYYRIKQIDVDSRFSYSSIIKLSNNQIGSLSIYPNPVTDKATLQFSDNKLLNTTAKLTDMNGRQVSTIAIKNNFEIIDMSKLPTGIYMLKLADGTVQKIIKE